MIRIKSFLTIHHSISLLRQHGETHGQQLNQRIFSLIMQFSLEYNAEFLKKVEILIALFLSINLSPWNWFLL